jgi:transposase InsO family protein
VGHLGVSATLRAMKADGWNHPSLQTVVKSHIAYCKICQKRNNGGAVKDYEQRPTATLVPFRHLSIDTVGPLPSDLEGNCYIIAVIDRFTRYVELFPTRTCTAREGAKALLAVFSRYGPPMSVRSDQGSQFSANVIQELLALLQVEHEMTIPYRPEANGLIERANAEIVKHLKTIVATKDVRHTWSTFLPLVARSINQAWHSAIDCAPARLVHGTIATLQRSLVNFDTDEPQVDLAHASDYVVAFCKAQKAILSASANFQRILLSKLMKKYQKDQPAGFAPGDHVLWQPPTKADKFALAWAGPYSVVSPDTQLNSYIIEDILTKKRRTVHISTLKPFAFHSQPDLDEAAKMGNLNLDRVEKIVAHAVDEPTGALMFLVRWAGYGPEDDTWELLPTVDKLAALDEYLIENPELKLSPLTNKKG